jgi:hypothetical protein
MNPGRLAGGNARMGRYLKRPGVAAYLPTGANLSGAETRTGEAAIR